MTDSSDARSAAYSSGHGSDEIARDATSSPDNSAAGVPYSAPPTTATGRSQIDTPQGRLAYARYLQHAHPDTLEDFLLGFTPAERRRLIVGLRTEM